MSTQGQTVAEANNWLALEPRLVQLVQQAVQGIKPAVHVLTSADLAEVKEGAQKTPAVHLIYGGYRVTDDLGTAWSLAHTWYAVVVVRNVATQRSGQAARQSAGPLVAAVVGALVGAKVAGATRPLTLLSPPPASYRAGHQYIPSAFEAETIFRKPQN
ncbi:MAG: hypothetical protein K2X65_08515 [Burkholderiaceae bacterium]|nr:hypothetical protein [Burkholderiaceae bacterium]